MIHETLRALIATGVVLALVFILSYAMLKLSRDTRSIAGGADTLLLTISTGSAILAATCTLLDTLIQLN